MPTINWEVTELSLIHISVINNLPLGTYYLKEVVAGENFVLNTEQKEFTLTAEDDTPVSYTHLDVYKRQGQ